MLKGSPKGICLSEWLLKELLSQMEGAPEADSLPSSMRLSPAYYRAESVSEPQERKTIVVTAEYVLNRTITTCEGTGS